MHLVQILLPLYDNQGKRFGREDFAGLRSEMLQRFGGVTAFVQSPAEGIWKDAESGTTAWDDVILIEVMTEVLDREWWSAYREKLEGDFRQEEIVMRATVCERL